MIQNINLTPMEAAQRLRVSVGTLANWRVQGNGPKFLKFGKKVLYPVALLESYEHGQTRSNTAQAA